MNGDGFISTFNALMANILLAQLTANIARNCQHFFLHRALHIDLQQEVHTAPQIEAKRHWQCIYGTEPMGCVGKQIQCNRKAGVIWIGIEFLLQ